MTRDRQIDNGKGSLMLGPLAFLIPWVLMRHMLEKTFGKHGFHSIEVCDGETTSDFGEWRAHSISYMHSRSLLKHDEGRTLRGLALGLLPFGLVYLIGKLAARRVITRMSGKERMADYRLFRIDRDYLLAYATEPMVSLGGPCMALSEALVLAREGQTARWAAERAREREAAAAETV